MTTIPDWRIKVYGFALSGAVERRGPGRGLRAIITEQQGGRCLYCDLKIGSIVRRWGRGVALRPNWDHFVPYAYSYRNRSQNWILACHVCNGIKSCHLFTTVAEAQEYIRDRRADRGYDLGELTR